MIDLETLAASCATMADEIVARGSSDTFRYDADGILEFGDSPEYYSPISSSAYRSEYPETAREYGYTREYLEQAERRLLACYLDRAMANMDYDYMKLSASRWSYPIAELDGFLAMFPPARSERRAIADRVLDSASMRLKTFFALSMPMAEAAGGQDGDEAEGGKHYHRAAAPDGGETAEE